jgi:hypothetical protein
VLTAAAGMVGRIDIAKAALQELRRAQRNISLCWIAPDGAWDKVLLTAAAQNLRQPVNSPSQTSRPPCLWAPLASFHRWRGDRKSVV